MEKEIGFFATTRFLETQVDDMASNTNPYIAGNPVGGGIAFIGRADILRDVLRILKIADEKEGIYEKMEFSCNEVQTNREIS